MTATTNPAEAADVAAPILAADGVTVRFGGVVALDQVSISVPVGSTIGLVGPNGAGKTTLFGVLSGLLRPRTGRVYMSGDDVTRRSPQTRARRGVSRTFQRMELFTELTVREHLVVARRVKDRRERLLGMARDLTGFGERPGPGEDEAVDAILELVGLADLADRPALAIPLGTGRLLEVARALASDPTVMLLDEPSSGLDVHETAQLGEALRRVRQERGTAFVLVEHNVDFVLGLSDRITVLDFGKLLVEGTPDEIRTSPEVQAAYFGAPLEASETGGADADRAGPEGTATDGEVEA
jgi:ABC-type branched-subunit amino acid transport system ATPase component